MKIKPVLMTEDDKTYKIFKIHFPSLTELELFLLKNPKVNEMVFPSQKSIYMARSFAGVPLEEAIAFCHGGYYEGFPLFLEMKKKIESVNTQTVMHRRSVPSVVGSRPHVPNFVAGTPKTMLRLDRAKETKFMDIYINLAYSGYTTEEQIRNRGILTLNLINLMEMNHVAVNLYAFEASYLYNEIFICDIRLKNPGEITNVGKCYYPLCGKEFVRRLMVRVKESMPFQEKWGLGYGMVLPEEKVRKCLGIDDNKILIKSPEEMGVWGRNIYDDADAFFEALHLSDNIKVPKYREYLETHKAMATT